MVMEILAHSFLKACFSLHVNKTVNLQFGSEQVYIFLCLSVGIARKLASSGYGVFAMDYVGFGLSEGLHGFVPSFEKLVDDVIEHYSKVKGMQ